MMQDYVPLQQIGKGSFGVVRKIKRIKDDKLFVWKQINFQKMTSREKKQLVTQVNLLRGLKHDNIVKYQDRIIDKAKSKIYIIMEYCSGGDLGSYLKKLKSKMTHLSQEVIWKVSYQILMALEYCHSRTLDKDGKGGKVFHRDIKPANLFINQNNNIKLGDFGLSRQMGEHSEFAQTHVGTPYYMSPEQVKNANYNEKSDIWSAGCLIYQMAALKRPFEAGNHLALAKKIEEGRFERIPLKYSQNLFQLIAKMLIVNPDKRLSAKELLQNPMFVMLTKQMRLKKRISEMKDREQELLKKQRQFDMMTKSITLNRSSQYQEETFLFKKKSSKQSQSNGFKVDRVRMSDKENKNWQNQDNY